MPIGAFGLLHLFGSSIAFVLGSQEPALHLLFFVIPGTIILGGAYWVNQSHVPPTRYRRIAGWMVFTALGLALVPLLMIDSPSIAIDSPALAMVTATGVGGFGGLIAGINEALAIERARDAERERLAKNHAEEQRERLEQLNHLLRHDLANDLTVIRGRTELVVDDADEETATELETVIRQTDAAIELIQNVRSYLEATRNDEDTLTTRDLSAVLEQEVTSLQSAYPEVHVETDIPAGVTVRADTLLPSVFSNLLRNAVVHNPSDPPEIHVDVTREDATATVRITDNGPGIPDHVLENLFEAADQGDHGFGLYLVKTLTERYGGSVTVESTGNEGTTIAVTLQQPTATTGNSS
ncbi:HAMP domain-containing sensor histidine kinase [Haloarcula sp. Atlit-7R]|uniref:sensor histidine kinase n=1 Tax=Haloarcula sp. Atlit-7R TaxID=2282125 RepID=UPI000EF14261|nr:HAMP domain-containing sensor histidine kinase [Haloarcula sp. Atlit-7R]RLM89528.1 sensor histidine kinase [Haloarcula sp. Atlit-7R]